MAVYTPLTKSDIDSFLSHYEVGALASFTGITEGVENTNYLVETASDRYILTIFEQRTKPEELPYFIHLMEWLSERGIQCPLPIKRRDGRALSVLKEKPALLVSFLEGSGVRGIRTEHLLQVGKLTADVHLAGMQFPYERENALSVFGWEKLVAGIDGRADEIEQGLDAVIEEELRYLREHWPSGLPSGPVHADLFPDNIFFYNKTLSGVIDFYFACNDAWAYDLAITFNAWCFDDRHRIVRERAEALMQSYNDVRSLTPEEDQAMPILLRGAALRFLLTRTYDWLNTPEGAQVVRKDPREYLAKLQFHQQAHS